MLFARSICGEHGRAEDAVHQVFLKIMNEHGLRNVENPKAYLFTCVRNAVISDTKSAQRTTALQDEGAWFEPPQRDYSAEIAADISRNVDHH